jgi:hypothetical protein
MRAFAIGLVTGIVFAVAVLAGFIFLPAGDLMRMPSCPSEDSCTIDYHDGGWHIYPDVP